MNILYLIILGLFIILIIQVLEVYLTLKLNHDLSDEVDELAQAYADLELRLRTAERKLISRENTEKEEEEKTDE